MSVNAFSLLQRMKASSNQVRSAATLTPDLLSTYTNTGVAAEVAACTGPTFLVPDCDGITKQEYEDLVAVFTELNNYWLNNVVVSQDNRAFVQKVFRGS
jgi:hypothetical protein